MLDVSTTGLSTIEATLNYLAPGADKPFAYAYDPPPGLPAHTERYEPHRVTVRNGRPLIRRFSLDREGFELRRHDTEVADFHDEGEVLQLYYPEMDELLRAATGAEKIVIFDHTLRNTAKGKRGERIREAGASVHNDYTVASAAKRVRDLLDPAEAEARLQRRYVEVNVWRPIAEPVQSWPLALCDAQSLDWDDLVVAERRYADRVGETYRVRFNPKHSWYYFPHMRRDEVLLIKCFDSETDGRARLSVHSAFEDPTTPAGAPPRRSIEIRAFAFF
ncbi:MAG TPA: CmcJ/NvfI family oxidoreductase [Candidatus Sulfotelmatobacter sp.]|nr:CmcJ/NvfI family oxidoreductase [Candidatus Sulfotelmatobacter sp.]